MRDSTKYLAESENFKITSESEVVMLHFKNSSKKSVYIGDFYGDPTSAVITYDEKYVVMGGCGLIVYKLEEPFAEYNYNQITHQYTEHFRDPKNIWWIETLYQSDMDEPREYIRFVLSNESGTVYRMNVKTFVIEKAH